MAIILLICTGAGYSQSTDEDLPERFSVEQGLPDATINCLAQDEDGFLWIGTYNGLSRFDGTEFKNFFHHAGLPSIPGNSIFSLLCLSHHRLLIATGSGLCLFNSISQSFQNLFIPCSTEMFPFENSFSGGMEQDDMGNIWTGTRTCIYQLDTNLNILQTFRGWDEKAVNKFRLLYAQSLYPLAGGNMIFQLQVGMGSKFFLFDSKDKSLVPFAKLKDQLFSFVGDSNFHSIQLDQHHNAYFIKRKVDSLYYFGFEERKIYASKIGKNIPLWQFSNNSKILAATNRAIYCSLTGGGVLILQPPRQNAGKINADSTQVILADEEIHCVLPDQENNLWIGSRRGLFKHRQKYADKQVVHFNNIHPATRLPQENGFIFNNKWGIFVATDGGGLYYNDNNNFLHWKNMIWKDHLPQTAEIWNIRPIGSGDTAWVGTQSGVYWWVFDTDKHGIVHWPRSLRKIDSIPITTQFMDHEGWVWMGMGFGNGLLAYNPLTKQYRHYQSKDKTNPLPIRYPTSIAEDDQNDIWMAGQDGTGLVRWTRNSDTFKIFTPVYNSAFDNGIIFSLLADHSDNLWIGTANGLIELNIRSLHFRKYDLADGLSSNIIYSLDRDDQQHLLLVGTKNGLNILNLATGKIRNLSKQYDLPSDFVTSIIYNNKDKKVYCASKHNLYSFTPVELNPNENIPKLQITGIAISGKPLSGNVPIELSAQNNNISISFTAVNLSSGNLNNYFYQLSGNKNWVSLGHQRQVNLSGLAPGNYNFRVKAQTDEGIWTNKEATVNFFVPTPFWRSGWFLSLVVAGIGGLFYLIYRYRIRQIMQMQQVRNRIATDLHDDIGSTLTNINILTELSHANIQEPEKASGFLSRIAEEVNSSSQALDDIVWSINTKNDSFGQIAARIRRYAAELFDAESIRYSLKLDEKLSEREVHMEKRRDIYLICKEALHNVYKHALANMVSLELTEEKNNLILKIWDDGKGIDYDPHSGRNGLRNMVGRAEKWKGKCSIDSDPQTGTRIIVSIPLQH